MPLTADELATQLRDEIRSGQLPQGQKLPSINDLIATRNVGRGAAQHALNKLRAEGLIASRQGAGNYVQGGFERLDLTGGSPRGVSGEGVPANRRQVNVLRIDEVPAPDYVADGLGIKPEEPVLYRRHRVDIDGKPGHIEDSYYPVDLARGSSIVYHDTGPAGVLARLGDKGVKASYFTERILARPASDEEVDILGLRSGGWVMEIRRLTWTKKRCVEVQTTVFDASSFEVTYKFQG